MDLYQAMKTDKCHSSPGRLQVNPDQWGVSHTQHTTPSMPQCHLDTFSQPEHDDRSTVFLDFCLSSSTYDVIVANKRSNQHSRFSSCECLSGRSGTSNSHISAFMFKEIINVAKAFGSPGRKANTVHIPFPLGATRKVVQCNQKMHRVSVAKRKKAQQI